VIVSEDMLRKSPVVAGIYPHSHQKRILVVKRGFLYTPVFPEGIEGLTIILSLPSNERCELYVALIVPESSLYGTASLLVGVTGAGSSAVPKASLKLNVPAYDALGSESSSPHALNDKLNFFPSGSSIPTVRAFVSLTELTNL
jgi:hypothetical protein